MQRTHLIAQLPTHTSAQIVEYWNLLLSSCLIGQYSGFQFERGRVVVVNCAGRGTGAVRVQGWALGRPGLHMEGMTDTPNCSSKEVPSVCYTSQPFTSERHFNPESKPGTLHAVLRCCSCLKKMREREQCRSSGATLQHTSPW